MTFNLTLNSYNHLIFDNLSPLNLNHLCNDLTVGAKCYVQGQPQNAFRGTIEKLAGVINKKINFVRRYAIFILTKRPHI